MRKEYHMSKILLLAVILVCTVHTVGAMTMYVDDIEGGYGTTIDVPINVSDASDVGAMDISLTYNSSVLSPAGIVSTGGLTAGALVLNETTIYIDTDTGKETISDADNQTVWDYGALANYTGTSGVVNISIICNASDVGFNGAGSIAVIRFAVIGTGESQLDLNAEAYNVSAPIPNATDPDKIDGYESIAITLVNGTFETGGSGLPQDGNIDGVGGIDMDDVIHLAKHYYGTDLFPDHGTIYADGDINCDGDIDMDDVIYLAKHYYGTDLFPDYGTLYPCE
jgi:hypothetical protein